MSESKPKLTPLAASALNLLQASPELVVALIAPLAPAPDVCSDVHLAAAIGLAHARTANTQEGALWFKRLLVLLPENVEVAVCLAEAAMANADPATAVTALERAFALDKDATTPAGRRARVLAFKLEKQLG